MWTRRIRPASLLLGAVVVLLGAGLGAAGYRGVAQYRLRAATEIRVPAGLDALERVRLGGVEQWVLLRGRDRTQPVLLWVDAPGSTSLPLARQRDAGLVERFVVVHWDPRGTGKSFRADLDPGTLTVEQYVADAQALVEWLRGRLGVERVYLAGHSWGSVVAALLVGRHPELFEAFIGVGQAVEFGESLRLGYAFALAEARQRNHQKALAELAALGAPPWRDPVRVRTLGRWVGEFGGTGRRFSLFDYARGVFVSPDYTLADLYQFARGQARSIDTLVASGELLGVSLFEQAPRLEVPVYFFQGRHDQTSPGAVVKRYFQELEAPRGKALVWFEESAHFPQWEEPKKFAQELTVRVLGETQREN